MRRGTFFDQRTDGQNIFGQKDGRQHFGWTEGKFSDGRTDGKSSDDGSMAKFSTEIFWVKNFRADNFHAETPAGRLASKKYFNPMRLLT